MTSSRACALASLTLLLGIGPAAAQADHHGVNISIHDGNDPARCEDIEIAIGNRPAARGQERLVIPVEAGKPLRVQTAESSGVHVRGTERGDFEVLLCKAARSQEDLSRISLARQAGTVAVDGPAGQDWVGYLLILAPKRASIELSAVNGSISLSGLSGQVSARSKNGPISVQDCPGDIDLQAENGPIQFRGDGGRLHLRTENGPIGVSLSGAVWKGAGLDARAVNGPVRLSIPSGYASGAIVETLGHSPFQCRGEACAGARRTWDDTGKRVEFGAGPTLVRLSTENGPVSVRSGSSAAPDDEDDE